MPKSTSATCLRLTLHLVVDQSLSQGISQAKLGQRLCLCHPRGWMASKNAAPASAHACSSQLWAQLLSSHCLKWYFWERCDDPRAMERAEQMTRVFPLSRMAVSASFTTTGASGCRPKEVPGTSQLSAGPQGQVFFPAGKETGSSVTSQQEVRT